MTSSLVGSEMCIRDSHNHPTQVPAPPIQPSAIRHYGGSSHPGTTFPTTCLLYTSDAADDM
eukprot:2008305-Prorocentrum_lima.AAC.1